MGKKNKKQALKSTNYVNPNSIPKHIAIDTKKNIKILNVISIIYIEASGGTSIFYLEDKTKINASKNLGFYENILKTKDFFRIHRSYIINISYLENIINDHNGQYCILKGDCIVPISNRKFPFIKKLLHY